jgi:hypothetical protein
VRVANRICTTRAAWWQACQAPTTSASVTSRRWRATKRTPARRSAQNFAIGEPAPLGRASGSRTGTPRRIEAENASSTASTSKASGAPTTLISTPASPGPRTSAPEPARAFLACASTRRSRGTTWVRTICAALPATVKTVPIRRPMTYSQPIVSQPAHQASGTLATARPSMHSPAM